MHRHYLRKRPDFIAKLFDQLEGKVSRSVKFLRILIVVALVTLVGVETGEFQSNKPNAFHVGEILIYFALLSSLGLLVEVLAHPYASRISKNKRNQRTAMMLQKIETWLTKSAKFFRLAIAAALIILVGVETAEFQFRISDTFHLGEIIIYFVLLGILGLLVEVILHSHKQQQHSMDILRYKHKISLEILTSQSWEALTELLTRQVAEIVDAVAASLYFSRPYDGLEPIAEWMDINFTGDPPNSLQCMICVRTNEANGLQSHYCDYSTDKATCQKNRSYCYPVFYRGDVYALFRFVLRPEKVVTEEQKEILNSISYEPTVHR